MESWMVSVVVALVGVVSTFAVLRSNVHRLNETNKEQGKKLEELEKFRNESAPVIAHLSKVEDSMFAKIDSHSESLTALKEQVGQVPSMKEVRDEFVTKELFLQMQKHMDEKFDHLDKGLGKILDKLEERA